MAEDTKYSSMLLNVYLNAHQLGLIRVKFDGRAGKNPTEPESINRNESEPNIAFRSIKTQNVLRCKNGDVE